MMRKLTIASATKMEVGPIKDYLHENGLILSENKFSLRDLQIEILYTGIGTMNTTYTLMDYLSHGKPDGWIQMGIGGSLDRSVNIGEVFQIESEMVHGEGAQEKDGNLLDPFTLGWSDSNKKPFTDGKMLCPFNSGLSMASGMTTYYAHGEKNAINQLKSHDHGQIENMEGAPFFYISLMKEIPFLSIRSVSNFVEPRNKSGWDIPLALKNLNQTVIQLMADADFNIDHLFRRLTD
jgi:futalosine hydrolase